MNLQRLLYLLAQIHWNFPDLLLTVLTLSDVDVHVVDLLVCVGAEASHRLLPIVSSAALVPLALAVAEPTNAQLVSRKLREEARPYFRDLVQIVYLYHDLHGLLGQDLGRRRVHSVVRRTVALHFEAHAVRTTFVS